MTKSSSTKKRTSSTKKRVVKRKSVMTPTKMAKLQSFLRKNRNILVGSGVGLAGAGLLGTSYLKRVELLSRLNKAKSYGATHFGKAQISTKKAWETMFPVKKV